MADSVFVEARFWLLVASSLLAPVLMYGAMRTTRALARHTVLGMGLLLVALSGVDVYLLQALQTLARLSPSTIDDAVFDSEISIALYVLPIFFGGVGVNVISHLIVRHLTAIGTRFDEREERRS